MRTASLPDTGALAIEHLTISYLRRNRVLPVLTDVSFRIEPGEAYGLVGEFGMRQDHGGDGGDGLSCPTNARIEAGRIMLQGIDLTTAGEA